MGSKPVTGYFHSNYIQTAVFAQSTVRLLQNKLTCQQNNTECLALRISSGHGPQGVCETSASTKKYN